LWSRVGYLVETPAAYPDLTVTENLAVAARLRGPTGDRPITDVIARLGLKPYTHTAAPGRCHSATHNDLGWPRR
jgi:ABC-2 type transport system ATP-binding protein